MTQEQPAEAFRCPVQPEQAKGELLVGRKRIPVTLVDTSAEGFTLTVLKSNARGLRHDRAWKLLANGEQTIVHPEWMFNAPNGDAQLGVRRLEDVTPVSMPKSTRRILPNLAGSSSLSGIALAGMVFLIIAIICLPGVGDDLGTAPAVQSMLRDSFKEVSLSVRQFLSS